MSFDLAVVLGFLLVSAGLLFLLLVVGKLLRINKPDPEKLSTYECAERPYGSAWFNFNNRFYVIALVFVAFDVQVALAVPVVVVFRKLLGIESGAGLFATLFVYLAVMMLALAYVWRHGDLSWIKDVADGRNATTPTRAVGGVPSRQAAGRAEGSL